MINTVNREWILASLVNGIERERRVVEEYRSRVESPPDAALGTLYGEIAQSDERHARLLETIAVRYGHTPERSARGGLGKAITRIKERVTELGASPIDRLQDDLEAKSRALHTYSAWLTMFESIGDVESARELAAVLTEETAHQEALLEALRSLFVKNASVEDGELPAEPS